MNLAEVLKSLNDISRCQACGSMIGSHAIYCSKCGLKREDEPKPYTDGELSFVHGLLDKEESGADHKVLISMYADPDSILQEKQFCPECGEKIL